MGQGGIVPIITQSQVHQQVMEDDDEYNQATGLPMHITKYCPADGEGKLKAWTMKTITLRILIQWEDNGTYQGVRL